MTLFVQQVVEAVHDVAGHGGQQWMCRQSACAFVQDTRFNRADSGVTALEWLAAEVHARDGHPGLVWLCRHDVCVLGRVAPRYASGLPYLDCEPDDEALEDGGFEDLEDWREAALGRIDGQVCRAVEQYQAERVLGLG